MLALELVENSGVMPSLKTLPFALCKKADSKTQTCGPSPRVSEWMSTVY